MLELNYIFKKYQLPTTNIITYVNNKLHFI